MTASIDLLLRISHCPNVSRCLADAPRHPCHKVVAAQATFGGEFVLPEPWSGRLETAPVLFLSSNPSISGGEMAPRRGWTDADIIDFYANRFGGGRREWIRDGVRNLQQDGTHRRHPVRFWVAVKHRAAELLSVPAAKVRPGIDYALSEVVHCNSPKEEGVPEALEECSRRYLEPVIAAAGARVIVTLGVRARDAVRRQFGTSSETTAGPIRIGHRDRHFAFLPHPNAFKPKTFARCIPADELVALRARL